MSLAFGVMTVMASKRVPVHAAARPPGVMIALLPGRARRCGSDGSEPYSPSRNDGRAARIGSDPELRIKVSLASGGVPCHLGQSYALRYHICVSLSLPLTLCATLVGASRMYKSFSTGRGRSAVLAHACAGPNPCHRR